MKIHECEQGSADWLIARSGIPTASELDRLVDTKFAPRTGETPKSYLAMKLAEAWQHGPILGANSFAMEQGHFIEQDAFNFYQLTFGKRLKKVGFITTDDGRFGCSPDAIIEGEECGLEIKCPSPETHVKYLLKGVVPTDYAPQVHMSLYVTGWKQWEFLSFRRGYPPLRLLVHRDEDIIKKIQSALDYFTEAFDEAMKRLEQINGGPSDFKAPLPRGTGSQHIESDEAHPTTVFDNIP